MRKPKRSMRFMITAGRPTRIGLANPSSMTTCTARSTRSSSPSAYTMRFGAALAAVKTGFISSPE
jgi:hypothetical protein